MKYYLAYGSNLNKKQMGYRCPGAVPVGTAEILGYRLAFRRGYLTIEPDAEERVPVGVWKITQANERALDRYEGYPRFYFKKSVKVMTESGKALNGMVYIMQDGHPVERPTTNYANTCLQGCRDFGISPRKLFAAYDYALENEYWKPGKEEAR